ncbi:unnamed protein product [Rotaria sordida]|uniref:Uncharacterized protein n=1 Tax=Rotaria sordida TaxID=392033 RepID=A0A815QL36_9BILA|nr:unnamed protein product [Rotaria sordida]
MMSNGSQEQQQSVISKENSILTCQSDIQQQQSITQSSAGSTNSVASSSINNKYNESYLREKYGIKDFRINLVDCMKCYVRIPRCTLPDSKFEQQPVSDTNQNVQTNLARESSAGSTNSVASSSINNKYNESYLREKYGIKDFRINLVDCMKCYVRIPRCTLIDSKFEQPPVSDTNQNVQTNMAREVQEYREEQEIVLEKQHHQTTSEIVEEDYQPIDYLDDYNPMNTLIIVDLPWPETSE